MAQEGDDDLALYEIRHWDTLARDVEQLEVLGAAASRPAMRCNSKINCKTLFDIEGARVSAGLIGKAVSAAELEPLVRRGAV